MKTLLRSLLAIGLLALTFLPAPTAVRAATGPLCYVDQDAGGGGQTGNSWGDAYLYLQVALSDANCDEIWVAEGVYKPAGGVDQTLSFNISAGEGVYGGFAAWEAVRDHRDPQANVTILSGDVGSDDVNVDGNNVAETSAAITGTNSYHVVRFDGVSEDVTASTVLDGFVITAGRANALFNDKGGGLYCDGSGAGNVCSPTLAQLTISGNWAWYGGGQHNNGTSGGNSSPTLTDVTFTGNNNGGTGTGMAGGGLYNDGAGGNSSPTLVRVTFNANGSVTTTNSGGGMYDDGTAGLSSPMLTGVTFHGNGALFGGGLSHSGGDFSDLQMWDVTFYGNSANNSGGAMYQSGAGTMDNGILWGNNAVNLGPEIYGDGNLYITHSLVQGSGGSGGSWNAGLGTDGGGNLDADPMLGPLADNGGFTRTMALLAGSAAIDAGHAFSCAGQDQRGRPRPRGPACDMGAFERLPDPAAFGYGYISDVVVYRGGAWNFYDFTSGLYLGGSSKWTGYPGGACIAAPMDYDGDGDKDFTQLCSGAWNFYNDAGALVKGIWVGNMAGLKPVPADYNGDGTEDIVVFNAGAWNKYDYTSGAYVSGVWTGNPGGNGIPSPMDYDGNGTADPTILSGGAWHFYTDVGTYNKGIWVGNVAGQLPVPGDYHGDELEDNHADGIDDVMVFRAGAWLPYDFETGAFLAGQSVWTGNPAPPAGGGATKPAPLDYNGDGTLDFTVFAGGPWHFYNYNGTYNKGIWVGKNVIDVPISRRPLP